MKQIYYTQCPIGYGLGASNGFQIKRLSEGYSVTSDFRHLGLRAFVPGTRQLAPPTLRFRRGDGGEAEVAFLTPRSHEYETERGPWGRPGGHFAHGLQLDEAELAAIHFWPAGLYDASFWVASDREPSREQSPPALAIALEQAGGLAAFDRVGQTSQALGADLLARLLTSVATVVREGRTLFLIDVPERLAPLVALLTFAFPEPCRRGLTFSTYHDRPEELPGLRLQGTAAAARPNRSVLLSLGVLADLEKPTVEPETNPAPWARTLAGWLTRGDETARRAFEATHRRGRVAGERDPAECWEDAWLDNLVALDATLGDTHVAADWSQLAQLASWCGHAGLGQEWTDARGARWWHEHVGRDERALAALVAHLSLPTAWLARECAPAWGRAFARAVEHGPAAMRSPSLQAVVQAAPLEQRPAFVSAFVLDLPHVLATEALDELRALPACGPALLLPLEIHSAVESLRGPAPTQELLHRVVAALARPATVPVVLDALAEAARQRPESGSAVARTLAEAFETGGPRGRVLIVSWALGREDGVDWLKPVLRRAFADPLNIETWRAILAGAPPQRRAHFARAALVIAADPTLPDEAYRWAVEEALLPLPANERPRDPQWPGEFLSRTRSDLDLIRWLYVKRSLKPGVKAWLNEARERGDLRPTHEARLDACKEYARVLRAGDARALLDIRLPIVPAGQRGAVLGQILSSIDTTSAGALELALDAAREAWPGGFQAGAEGLAGLGAALSEVLQPLADDPEAWLEHLTRALQRLGVGREGSGFEPHGLAAETLAAATRAGSERFSPWRLRHHVLQSAGAWRCLALDVRRDLEQSPRTQSLDALETWDRALEKGLDTARFFEVWLNACDGRSLALAVASRAAALKGFDLPWWDHPSHPGARDDLRDAFARLAPLAPLPLPALLEIEK
ncbi:MAG: hypothetical protein P4L84_15750, partial [Isosphaeraceae bacterium]|nr:hypothetical protein [Isosphaeraceae bacterium]